MDTNALKKFAQAARNLLIDQVTARLDMVLAEGAAARREHPFAIRELEAACAKGRQQVIEQVAYTWFNRFTALRFMDATQLTNPRVVSPADGTTRPEILAEASAGNLPDKARAEIADYLNGTRRAHDGQAEAYRLLMIHACNHWHGCMPFMFERAEDYTELLMPDDLLSSDSILARLRQVMTEDACKDVEIIGWLYQFYISEKKDQVFAGLKKSVKITAENIPAATQLFTPHWIVRYLVENSLGRLWLLNRPQSKLAEKMDYYIAPVEPETDFLRISGPEDIRVCDPACGSGHMLTYAFDLLHEVYAEEGYDAADIPGLILTHNLTGIEIDDRAGALAAFALSMKAATKLGRRRFLRMEARPNIVVLQNVSLTPEDVRTVATMVGRDLFTVELRETLMQFEQAKNFGSLIVPKLRAPAETLRVLESRDCGDDLLLGEVQERVVTVLRMAEALSSKYHVVVANPPYMGKSNMNLSLQSFASDGFKDAKADLFAMFMKRGLSLGPVGGLLSMINMQSWMFLSAYEELRTSLLANSTLLTMAHLGERAFDSIGGAVVSTTAFVIQNKRNDTLEGTFIRLVDGRNEAEKSLKLRNAATSPQVASVYRSRNKDFLRIPGKLIAYWLSETFSANFERMPRLGDRLTSREGLTTGSNDTFLRHWFEVSSVNCKLPNREHRATRWHAYLKGGDFRRWSGNTEFVVDWENDGRSILTFADEKTGRIRSHNYNGKWANLPGVTWSSVSGSDFSVRNVSGGFMFDTTGSMGFVEADELRHGVLALLNSKVSGSYMRVLSPAIRFQPGHALNIPCSATALSASKRHAISCVELSQADWDAYETSWDFATLPLISADHRAETLEATYAHLRTHWQGMTDEMQRLEEENNRIFIDAYKLGDELTPEAPIEEITLTCNPAYRYGVKMSEPDRGARLREDTMAEFVHYAVGCMFGRYSLDAPGLILANQGEGIEEYLARVPDPSFVPDRDNVIPVLDADWFADDIVARFREFLRVTFGEPKFRENLAFIENALGKDLRKWFTKDFFEYHVRRYKKRPIYWMFSSPKGTFNALIYMHRYRPDTVSVVLNQYLREFISKLETERARLEKLADDPTATQSQRTKAVKDVGAIVKQVDELTAWERDVVYPLAQKRVPIDLDDGVKQNYPLFGAALKPIKGLEASDD